MNFDCFDEIAERIKGIGYGKSIDFDVNSFNPIPEQVCLDDITIQLRQRFCSNGLIDNIIINLSKIDSIRFGLWILGTSFQKNFETYVLSLNNENSSIKEVWFDFRPNMTVDNSLILDNPHVVSSLIKFKWTAISIENLIRSSDYLSCDRISAYITNSEREVFTMEQFNNRDVLIGFGDMKGSCLAAEFFLNFGLEVSDVNYEYIKSEFVPNSLATENSCEIRVELDQKDQKTDKLTSEKN